MTKSATIRARMDPTLKDEAEAILSELGLSTTQALTLFYQQIRLNRGIPFDVRLPKEMPESNSSGHPISLDTSFPVHEKRAIMEQNAAAYKAMHPQLLEQYADQHVAIYDGELVDHDSDPTALLRRISANYPDQIVLRRKVTQEPERELRIRHPLFERDS